MPQENEESLSEENPSRTIRTPIVIPTACMEFSSPSVTSGDSHGEVTTPTQDHCSTETSHNHFQDKNSW